MLQDVKNSLRCPFLSIDVGIIECVYMGGSSCKDIKIAPENSDAWCNWIIEAAEQRSLNQFRLETGKKEK